MVSIDEEEMRCLDDARKAGLLWRETAGRNGVALLGDPGQAKQDRRRGPGMLLEIGCTVLPG